MFSYLSRFLFNLVFLGFGSVVSASNISGASGKGGVVPGGGFGGSGGGFRGPGGGSAVAPLRHSPHYVASGGSCVFLRFSNVSLGFHP